MAGNRKAIHTEIGIREEMFGGRTSKEEEEGGDVDDGRLEDLERAVGEVKRWRAK
jgi:hypothetical protein